MSGSLVTSRPASIEQCYDVCGFWPKRQESGACVAGGSVEEGGRVLETVEWVVRGRMVDGVAEGCGRWDSKKETAERDVSVSGVDLRLKGSEKILPEKLLEEAMMKSEVVKEGETWSKVVSEV